ncbi:hypothetical protein GT204_24575 [Streptomyces sp. SID4919]|uniref:hypothetical protein n=1 Tax=Streptomyces TaxID=1883 RepID=UPI000823DD4D|nr:MULTISPECIES: hypothetical protein [unclassified Streptomyces]MYY11988.1 hypothetical protein [Streptomyces sp. SID4919]WST68643.1 hypothetical protein OG268_14650 [Streptomyces uncialis]SCK13925.1 hypothetical protein YW7DRAFT_00887 [Streptomyces sp. AmelKG-E11A]
MGHWGYYVVGRSGQALDSADALASVRDELALLERRADGWQVWECRGGEDGTTIGSMNALALETGSPALFGYVMDSACVVVEAAAPDSGGWTTCLDRNAMADHLGRDERALEDYFLVPADAAQRAVVWAAEGGATVPAGPIAEVLGAPADPSAEQLFFRFLDRLGVVRL